MSIWIEAGRATALALADQSNNPFLAWVNALEGATFTSPAVSSDGAAINVKTESTFDRWRPTGSGSLTLEALFPAATALTFVAIAAHTFGKIGASVHLEYNLSAAAGIWVSLGGAIAAQDAVMAWRFASISPWRIRLTVSGIAVAATANLAVWFAGNELILPSRIYQGFSPRIVQTDVEVESNVSEGGNLLSSAVVRKGSRLEPSLTLLPDSFVRGDLKPFLQHFNYAHGFFFAWRPAKYADDIHYGWRDGATLQPQNSGPKAYMSLAMRMRVFDG